MLEDGRIVLAHLVPEVEPVPVRGGGAAGAGADGMTRHFARAAGHGTGFRVPVGNVCWRSDGTAVRRGGNPFGQGRP